MELHLYEQVVKCQFDTDDAIFLASFCLSYKTSQSWKCLWVSDAGEENKVSSTGICQTDLINGIDKVNPFIYNGIGFTANGWFTTEILLFISTVFIMYCAVLFPANFNMTSVCLYVFVYVNTHTYMYTQYKHIITLEQIDQSKRGLCH